MPHHLRRVLRRVPRSSNHSLPWQSQQADIPAFGRAFCSAGVALSGADPFFTYAWLASSHASPACACGHPPCCRWNLSDLFLRPRLSRHFDPSSNASWQPCFLAARKSGPRTPAPESEHGQSLAPALVDSERTRVVEPRSTRLACARGEPRGHGRARFRGAPTHSLLLPGGDAPKLERVCKTEVGDPSSRA